MRYLFVLALSFLVVNCSLFCAEDEVDWVTSNLYRRYVKCISYETVGLSTVATIVCSDQTEWQFIVNPDEHLVLDKFQNNLKDNIELFLAPVEKNPQYWLGNELVFRVYICKESLSFLPTIVAMERIIISEAGWFTREETKYLITLSDGSLWDIKNLGSFLYSWEVGHHVILGRLGASCPQVINVEASYKYDIGGFYFDFRGITGSRVKMLVPPSAGTNFTN